LLPRLPHERGAGRREPEAELAARVVRERARRQVLARRSAVLALPQAPLVVRGRALQQVAQPVLPAPPRIFAGPRLLVLERHAEPVGEELDRADEVEPLRLADERDRVAALVAPEAVVRAARGRDVERRRPLLVERAEAHVAGARLPQAHPRL